MKETVNIISETSDETNGTLPLTKTPEKTRKKGKSFEIFVLPLNQRQNCCPYKVIERVGDPLICLDDSGAVSSKSWRGGGIGANFSKSSENDSEE